MKYDPVCTFEVKDRNVINTLLSKAIVLNFELSKLKNNNDTSCIEKCPFECESVYI